MAKTATKRKARPAAKCKHNLCDAIIGGTRVIAYRCWRCSALGVRSLGPSDDEPEAVRVEISAAAHIQDFECDDADDPRLTHAEIDGFAMAEESPFRLLGGWDVGFLARVAVHDDGTGWPWDPKRPVVGQQLGGVDLGPAIDQLLEEGEAARRDAKEWQAALDAARDRPIGAPEAFDDEHHDPVDARFDSTDEILPDEAAK